MAAALINFCEKFEAKLLAPYLDGLLGKMLELVKTPNKMVQEQALTAVASIATCAQSFFIPYYPTFVPLLKDILGQAVSEEQRVLRGKAMECFSLIGIAVGKDTFKKGKKITPLLKFQLRIAIIPHTPDCPFQSVS